MNTAPISVSDLYAQALAAIDAARAAGRITDHTYARRLAWFRTTFESKAALSEQIATCRAMIALCNAR